MEVRRTWPTGKLITFSLDERVDCAWLQSGHTGHRGTDRMPGRGDSRQEILLKVMKGAVKILKTVKIRESSRTHLSQFFLQSAEKKKTFAFDLVNQ